MAILNPNYAITKRAKTVLGDTKRPNTTKDVSSEKWRKVNWTNIY